MPNHENLNVWIDAADLAVDTYRITESWPRGERYGLTSQLRRAAASIGANIAEGAGRGTDADFRRFLRIATGSANEVQHYLALASRLELMSADECADLTQKIRAVRSQLGSLQRRLSVTDPA